MVRLEAAENSAGTPQLPVGGKSVVQSQVDISNALQVVGGQNDEEPVPVESVCSNSAPIDLGSKQKETWMMTWR